MFQNWDVDVPQQTQKKVQILSQQIEKLQQDREQYARKPLLSSHSSALLNKHSQMSQSVDKLMDREKANILNIIDNDLHNRASPARSIMNASQISSISFQESIHQKANKTYNSISTAAPQHSPQTVSTNYISNNSNSVKCFSAHTRQESDVLLGQMTLKVEEQRKEITSIKKQHEMEFNHLKTTVIDKLNKQKSTYEELLAIKEQEIQQSHQREQQLSLQLQQVQQEKQIQEQNMNKFKDNLMAKLTRYSAMLEQYNQREELISQMNKENVQLKQERDEMALRLKQLLR